MSKKKMPYDDYLKAIAKIVGCKATDFTEDAYRDHYDEGLTPREAVNEDFQDYGR